jgi:hypothetical protein
VNLSVHQDGGHPSTGIQEILGTKAGTVKIRMACHHEQIPRSSFCSTTNEILNDTEILARCILAKVGESSEWISITNSAEENRVNICEVLDGKPLYSTLYGMYAVTLNELKAVLKVSAETGQSDAVNKTSVELTAQDGKFQEVKRCKGHISNNT